MGKVEDGIILSERDPETGQSSKSASTDTLSAEVPPPSNTVRVRVSRDITRPLSASKLVRGLPRPVRKVYNTVVTWIRGPEPPRIWKIKPFLPKIQAAPLWLVDRVAPRRRHKIALLGIFYFVWLLIFITVLDRTAFSSAIPGYGTPSTISCADTFWSDKNGCGVNGDECRPFANTSFVFRCPANCLPTEKLNPHAVGAQELIYRPLVVGGPTDLRQSVESAYYRGDSFICSSAIHAGYISNARGGCGVVNLIGSRSTYPAVSQNGIDSLGFDSNFPLSLGFQPGVQDDCQDARWPLLGVSVTLTALLAIFTNSSRVFFWSIYCILFFHVALVSDPPPSSSYYTTVSTAIGVFLPATFCMGIVYQYCVRRQLTGLTAQFEKAVLWLGGCWVGALNSYTFDKIPIQRLTGHDLKQQPGAITALVIIVIVLLVIAIGQVWAIRREGRLPRYLALYCFMGLCLGLLAAVPHMNLRIHHYILALLLLPGTAIQTRPSLLYQGLLIGLFINGIARWGFDSVVQTGAELLSDGQIGSLLPMVNPPTINGTSITFSWKPDSGNSTDGISVLVNDVERFRGYAYDDSNNFTWMRQAPAGSPEYFRFGYMSGSSSLDYTKAGIWTANGTWIEMAPGASKLR